MNESSSDDAINPLLVDSLNHPLAGLLRQLLTREGRRELNQIIIDDEENILHALNAGVRVRAVYFSGEDGGVPEEIKAALPPDATIHEIAKRTSKKIFENEKASRLLAIADTPAYRDLETLNDATRDVVVLEDLSISGNIGNIVRTTLALNAGALLLLNMDPLDIYDRRLIRASRGYVFSLPIVTATTEAFLNYCRAHGRAIVVTAASASRNVDEIAALSEPLFIVFGSEKTGTSPEVMQAATIQIRIPIDARVESLNVSAAASITLYQRTAYNRRNNG